MNEYDLVWDRLETGLEQYDSGDPENSDVDVVLYGEIHGDPTIMATIVDEIEAIQPDGLLHEGYNDHGPAVIAGDHRYKDETETVEDLAERLETLYETDGASLAEDLRTEASSDEAFRELDPATLMTLETTISSYDPDDQLLAAECEVLADECSYHKTRQTDERLEMVDDGYEPFKDLVTTYVDDGRPVAGNDIDITPILERAHRYEDHSRREAALQGALERTIYSRNQTMAEQTIAVTTKVDGPVASIVGATHLQTPGIYKPFEDSGIDYAVRIPSSTLLPVEQDRLETQHTDLLCSNIGHQMLEQQRQLRFERAGLIHAQDNDMQG